MADGEEEGVDEIGEGLAAVEALEYEAATEDQAAPGLTGSTTNEKASGPRSWC